MGNDWKMVINDADDGRNEYALITGKSLHSIKNREGRVMWIELIAFVNIVTGELRLYHKSTVRKEGTETILKQLNKQKGTK